MRTFCKKWWMHSFVKVVNAQFCKNGGCPTWRESLRLKTVQSNLSFLMNPHWKWMGWRWSNAPPPQSKTANAFAVISVRHEPKQTIRWFIEFRSSRVAAQWLIHFLHVPFGGIFRWRTRPNEIYWIINHHLVTLFLTFVRGPSSWLMVRGASSTVAGLPKKRPRYRKRGEFNSGPRQEKHLLVCGCVCVRLQYLVRLCIDVLGFLLFLGN